MTQVQQPMHLSASVATTPEGERLIARMIADVPDENARRKTIEFLEKIKAGARDLYL